MLIQIIRRVANHCPADAELCEEQVFINDFFCMIAGGTHKLNIFSGIKYS